MLGYYGFMELNKFLQSIQEQQPKADLKKIEKAYHFAKKAHHGQKRQSGHDYFEHVAAVALTVASMHLDTDSICAALLHDTIEDTDTSQKNIKKEFGSEVAFLVLGLTKLRKFIFSSRQPYIENWRKMFVSMAKDVRVIMIKFADILHNLQTLEFLPKKTQDRIAQETIEIYAPIANRLRLGAIKGRLEDWAFKYTQPQEFRWLNQLTMRIYAEKEKALNQTLRNLEKLLQSENISVLSIHHRVKYLYSLYQKLLRKNLDIDQVYDLVAIRIIVPDIKDCYHALGIIHAKYRPLKGRIKDYIAQPKPNGYRSLHTTVFGEDGTIVEIQIRTQEMHDEAEYGIAAHWQYKEKITAKEMKILWIKQLAQISKNLKDEKSLEDLKINIFQDRIFVFTPKGDVIDLPEGSTPVDFAYAIHTDIGNTCVRAKINEEIAKLSAPLKNNDVVEITTDKNKKGPNLEWLDFVKTSFAKDKILSFKKKKIWEWTKKEYQ